jgi:purine-cytosine permease-like protein
MTSQVAGQRIFGRRGNWINTLLALTLMMGWETVGIVLGAIAIQTVVNYMVPSLNPTLLKGIGLLTMSVTMLLLSLYGHATIKKVSEWFSYLIIPLIAIMLIILATNGTFTHFNPNRSNGPLTSSGLVPTMLVAFAIVFATTGLSWTYMCAEYARYLPRTVSERKLVGAIFLAAYPIATIEFILGAFLALSGKISNPIYDMPKLLPGWFLVPFLVYTVLSIIIGFVPNAYSSGLNLIALGLPFKRQYTVFVDFVVTMIAGAYALFVLNFVAAFETFLALGLIWVAPWTTIFLITVFARGRDPNRAVSVFNWNALIALAAGMFASAMFANDYPVWIGPLSTALIGQGDLSIPIGALVAGPLYWYLQFGRSGAPEKIAQAAPATVHGMTPH